MEVKKMISKFYVLHKKAGLRSDELSGGTMHISVSSYLDFSDLHCEINMHF